MQICACAIFRKENKKQASRHAQCFDRNPAFCTERDFEKLTEQEKL
jgi:hypothetical protein